MDERREFIRFALAAGVLRFGSFRTKAGRDSPYFFNAGLFDDGARLGRLAGFYARRLLRAEREGEARFDMLFGPAYKGITLASATAVALASSGRDVSFAFNRKEAKDHGEGGTLIGAPLRGRVVIVDDVISAGTSVRESVDLIRAQGAEPAAVLIALDRQERGGTADAPTATSATQEVARLYGIPVLSIASLDDLLGYLEAGEGDAGHASYRDAIAAYRARYGTGA
ncbi:MAG TPA: orotate phosphoribosyltransferase [Burkholderiaceae bacterium]|nr:orotate phosphoribosyltransferase [Burkholderiaceae bacterium]